MKLMFLGVGSAFSPELGCSSAILEVNSKLILIDCGYDVFSKIKPFAEKIDAVCITHSHDDHSGSLSSLLLYRSKVLKLSPTPVICSKGVWNHLQKIFFQTIGPNLPSVAYHVGDSNFISIIETSGLHVDYLESCAFLFLEGTKTLLFSGDINSPCLNLVSLDPSRSIIFHDTWHEPSANHCWFRLLEEFSSFKIIGYHYMSEAKEIILSRFALAEPNQEYVF